MQFPAPNDEKQLPVYTVLTKHHPQKPGLFNFVDFSVNPQPIFMKFHTLFSIHVVTGLTSKIFIKTS